QVPVFTVKRQAKPVFTQGSSGQTITLSGTSGVLVTVHSASQRATYSGPTDFSQAGFSVLKEARLTEAFGGTVASGLWMGSPASHAALLVASTPVDVGHNDGGYQPATSGQSLNAGSSVRTGHTGHATVQFPDGSLMRVSPDTTITIQAAQLTNAGNLKSATIQQ